MWDQVFPMFLKCIQWNCFHYNSWVCDLIPRFWDLKKVCMMKMSEQTALTRSGFSRSIVISLYIGASKFVRSVNTEPSLTTYSKTASNRSTIEMSWSGPVEKWRNLHKSNQPKKQSVTFRSQKDEEGEKHKLPIKCRQGKHWKMNLRLQIKYGTSL